MPNRLKRYLALTAVLATSVAAQPRPNNYLTGVRHWTLGDVTRIVIETTSDFEFHRERVPNPDRLFFDLQRTRPRLGQKGQVTFSVNDPRLRQIRVAETQPGTARVVFDLEEGVDYTASRLTNPPRLIVELRPSAPVVSRAVPPSVAAVPATTPPVAAAEPAPVPAVLSKPAGSPELSASRKTAPATEVVAPPTSTTRTPQPILAGSGPSLPKQTPSVAPTDIPVPRKSTPLPPPPRAASLKGQSTMARVLGLKLGRIVLDAGHGGHDTGTIGPGGLMEKDLVLDVAQRLAELIQNRLGAEVVFTRTDDTFIPLERRTEIANEMKADLFLSIHANSSPVGSSSGVETYYLNFTSSKAAMEVAARENASSQKTIFELKDMLQRIALQDKVEESREFAERVQQALYSASLRANSRTRNRGVRKAPFVVLIGASMPSILAEIGFVSNPRDEALFKKNEFRQRIAEGLYQGVSKYAATLSQSAVAQK